jgi:hypothetical protein
MPFACAICCLTERERESQPLPIYDVGWCDLGINGKSCRTRFKSAALSPFDVILGESWLREHRVVLDYADNRLWQKDVEGNLRPLTFEGVRSDRNHDVRKHADIGGGGGCVACRRDIHHRRFPSGFTYRQCWILPRSCLRTLKSTLGDIPGIAPHISHRLTSFHPSS